jgi:PAS domain S-box-containing protein
MWAEIEGTPTTAMGALIVISIMLAGGLGWLLRHLFGTTLPAKEEAAREERELYKSESQAMRDLFERRQDKLLEHCEKESNKEREGSERRYAMALAEIKEIHRVQTQLLSLTRQRTLQSDAVINAEDAIWIKTLDGILLGWNRGAEELLGWRQEEVIEHPIYRIIPPELHSEEQEALKKIAQGERVGMYNTTRLHKDGRRVRMTITVSPVKDPTGRVIAASSIGRVVER